MLIYLWFGWDDWRFGVKTIFAVLGVLWQELPSAVLAAALI